MSFPYAPANNHGEFDDYDEKLKSVDTSKRPSTAHSTESPRLQTRYSTISGASQRDLSHHYSSKKQFWRLLFRVMNRWLASLVLCGLNIGVFKFYADRGVLTNTEKRVFNAIFLGLSLVLGLNIVAALKSMAGMFRWKILADRAHTLQEIDIILNIGSYMQVTKLMRISFDNPWRFICLLGWVLIGVGIQVGVSLLGLTFNHDSEGAIGSKTGLVNITSLAYFYPLSGNSEVTPTVTTQQATANLYGAISLTYHEGNPADPGFDENDQLLEYNSDNTDWNYHFREFSTNQGLSLRSNRSVTASSDCKYYPIVEGQFANDSSPVVIEKENGEKETLDWLLNYGPGATMWVYDNNGSESCGARCARLFAIRFKDPFPPLEETGTGHYFDCTVRISQVMNASPSEPDHLLPDDAAQWAGGAIGLAGYEDAPLRQIVRYTRANLWGLPGEITLNTNIVQYTLNRFAIGSIAAMDINNPSIETIGTAAWTGVILVVKWKWAYLVLAIILAVQLIIGICVVFKSNSVFCKDDSYLSMARLLRPVVERLGPSGCASTGEELARTFDKKMVYGVRSDETGTRHHLDIGEDILARKAFPLGTYDGEIGVEPLALRERGFDERK